MIGCCSRFSFPVTLLASVFLLSCDGSDHTSQRPTSPDSPSLLWAQVEIPDYDASGNTGETGERIYQARCVSCHGSKGLADGVAASYMTTRPRDFSIGEYKLHSTDGFPTDEDLFRTVTVGIPAYGMPSFAYLSAEERWAVVHYVKELGTTGYAARLKSEAVQEELGLNLETLDSRTRHAHTGALDRIAGESIEYARDQFQPDKTLTLGSPPPTSSESIVRGKVQYESLGCVSCHGVHGDGDGTSSDAMRDNEGRMVRPRDFREGPWYFKAGHRREDIVRVVMGGMPGTPMPSLDLGEEGRQKLWDVALYVEHLANTIMEN